jgi:hypothetical protein
MNKYEQLIEHIVNDDDAKARALFHAIVVERSRSIYESLMDDEHPSDDSVGDLVNSVDADEHGMHEEGEEGPMDLPGDDMSGEPGDEMGMGAGDGSAPATKDDIMDLESAIDELKAEFDRLMNTEGGEHEADDEAGEEMPFGDDESEEDGEAEEDEPEDSESEEDEEAVAEGKMPMKSVGGKKVPAFAADGKGKNDLTKDKKEKSEAEKLREYVDKIGDVYKQEPTKGEGKEIAASSKREGINAKSIVAGKNDMGGTTANIVKGGSNQDPDGKAIETPKNEYAKKRGDLPGAGSFKNVPGADAGKSSYKTKEGSYETGGRGQGNPTGKMAGTGKDTPASGDAFVKSPLNGAPGRAK